MVVGCGPPKATVAAVQAAAGGGLAAIRRGGGDEQFDDHAAADIRRAGFADVVALMAAAIWLAHRHQARHHLDPATTRGG